MINIPLYNNFQWMQYDNTIETVLLKLFKLCSSNIAPRQRVSLFKVFELTKNVSKKFIRNDRLKGENNRSTNLFHPAVEITQYHCTRSKHGRNHNRGKSQYSTRKRGETPFCLRRVNVALPLSLFNAFIRPTKCPILIISDRFYSRQREN